MIKVCGRILNLPPILYKGNVSAVSVRGGWNMLNVQFENPVPKATDKKLNNWGCLRLRDWSSNSASDKYGSAISEFRRIFGNCGIVTGHPLQEWTLKSDGRQDFTDRIHGGTIEGTIREAHWKRMNILLVILPTKEIVLYNRIKRCSDVTEGIHTVCVIGQSDKFFKVNGTYLANVALKFNLKLGGINHKLNDVDMGIISKGRTMVVGIDVVHPSPGSGKASVAPMVASIDKDLAQWPVDLRVQVRKGQEMLDKIREMLATRLTLWSKHHNAYPENILVYRDGVSESQYKQVLDEELKHMREASERQYSAVHQTPPRFTLIIVGKRHHTRFSPPPKHPASDNNGNPNRGLVVDRGITEARNWDFFLQSHTAIKGTARPAHYYVLWDEILTNMKLDSVHESIEPGIQPADRLERLTHSLCYLFGRATKAVSIPAPVYYADIACERAGRYLAEVPTDSESATTDKTAMTDTQRTKLCHDLQERIKVHEALKDTMFHV